MAKQLHKRFSTEEVKMFLQQYLDNKKKLPTSWRYCKLQEEGFSIFFKNTRKTLMDSPLNTKGKSQQERYPLRWRKT